MPTFWTEAVSRDMGHRLTAVAHCMQNTLTQYALAEPYHKALERALVERGKLLSSPIRQGSPVAADDHSLWSLHVMLAYAAASGTDQIGNDTRDWSSVAPIGAAAEFLGSAFDMMDDIQDEDGELVSSLGIALATPVTMGLFILTTAVLDDEHLPPEQRTPLSTMLTRTILASASGQFLDAKYEHSETVTDDDALEMTSLKSGTLFAVLYEMGGYAGALTRFPTQQAIAIGHDFARFGHHLGIRFQLENDRADALSPLKSDRARGKKTVPLVMETLVTGDITNKQDAGQAATRALISLANYEAQTSLDQLHERYGIAGTWLQWLLGEGVPA